MSNISNECKKSQNFLEKLKIPHKDKADTNHSQKIVIPTRRYASFSFEARYSSLSAHL